MAERVAALMRGVNVGGNKKVDMAQLRAALTDAGYDDARTYLQSGNAVFGVPTGHADAGNLDAVAKRVEATIRATFGFDSRVILRTKTQLERAMKDDPLLEIADNPSRHLVGFLAGNASRQGIAQLEAQSTDDDLVRVVKRHLYMWCPAGISASPLFKVNTDRLLGTQVTMRNWNTVVKLAAML